MTPDDITRISRPGKPLDGQAQVTPEPLFTRQPPPTRPQPVVAQPLPPAPRAPDPGGPAAAAQPFGAQPPPGQPPVGPAPYPPADLPGQVEILRNWVGALDRIVGIRTRVLLVLAAIAIGASGAAIYLALDANSDKASKQDLHELQNSLQGGGTSTGATTGDLGARLRTAESKAAAAQASVDGLRSEVDALRARLGAKGAVGDSTSTGGSASKGGSTSTGDSTPSGSPSGAGSDKGGSADAAGGKSPAPPSAGSGGVSGGGKSDHPSD